MAATLASSSASSASSTPRTLYRSLLRELRTSQQRIATSTSASPPPPSPRPSIIVLDKKFQSQPIVQIVRGTFRRQPSTASSGGKGGASASAAAGTDALTEMRNLETYLRSNRVHKELLARYNPLHDQTEQERVKATARRVGLDVPIEYQDPSMLEGSEQGEGQGQEYDVQGTIDKRKAKRTGPLPPPELD